MLRILAKVCWWVSAVGVGVMTTLITIQVASRWLWHYTPYWAEELPSFFLIWMVQLGAVWGVYQNTHLTAGMMPLWIKSAAYRRVIDKVTMLLLVIVLLILAKYGWDLAMFTMRQKTPAMQWPVGLLYFSVPVSCAAMALVYTGKLLPFGRAE